MKRLSVVIILLALVARPAPAQKEYHVYLPQVYSQVCNWSNSMSTWKVVVPEATTNYVLNPSGEIAGNFAAVGGGTHTRVNTFQFFDVYSYRVQTAANDQGGSWTMQALANAIHYVTVRVRGTLPASWDWSVDNAAYTAPALLEIVDGDWSLYGLQFPAAQCNGQTTFYIRQNGAGAGDFYVDGIQIEQKEYWTTFCDGTREGCEWNGAAHGSSSQRSAQSRAGGRVQDLQDDYWLNVSGFIGTGLPPITNTVDSYAILPGGELNSIKVQSRVFTLPGTLSGTSTANLHARRQDLLNVLKPNAVPEDANGPQPVRLRYTGAAVQKQIAAHYEAGLETSIDATLECWERVAIRFLADDPYWYEIGDSADVLDGNDTATLRYTAGRLRTTGQWDELGLINAPIGGGAVYAVLYASDNSVYIGGNFTGLNNVANRDYIARYIPATDTWETVGAGAAVNGAVEDIVEGPDGDIYISGAFTNVAGIAAADYIARWNGAAWSAVGVPVAGASAIVKADEMAFDRSGNLYIVGDFTTWANVANADYIAMWDGAAWNAVGGGGSGAALTIAIDSQDNLYVGGAFANWGGDADADNLAFYNGAAWSAVGSTAMNSTVFDIEISPDDFVYIGGAFTDAAGITDADLIVLWNGTAFSALATGITGTRVECIRVAPDSMIYVGGRFTAAGGITLADNLAKWNGASWAHLDVDLAGTPVVYDIDTGPSDPVIARNYDVYIGFSTSGVAAFAGDTIVANDGTEQAFPKFIVSRTGGTSATLEEIRNETTGRELLLDYGLLDGETLTIDLTPTNKSIISTFFGSRLDAVLANSDFGTFVLQPGDNLVTCFVNAVGGPTVNAFVQWDDKYWSQD